jgi:hypothetical protein
MKYASYTELAVAECMEAGDQLSKLLDVLDVDRNVRADKDRPSTLVVCSWQELQLRCAE